MPHRHLARCMSICLLSTVPALSSTVTAAAQPNTPADPRLVITSGTFAKPAMAKNAYTYAPQLVPAGAKATVFSYGSHYIGGTSTTLAVSGLQPDREYGAHAHSKPCGATGKAAGPHFQNVPDPVQPSVDPAYANPKNEIWLDFTTNRLGDGIAVSQVSWVGTDQRAPKSVVIHEMHTHTEPGMAGNAGKRLACINVNF